MILQGWETEKLFCWLNTLGIPSGMVASDVEDLRSGKTLREVVEVVFCNADPSMFKLSHSYEHPGDQELLNEALSITCSKSGIDIPSSFHKCMSYGWDDDSILQLLFLIKSCVYSDANRSRFLDEMKQDEKHLPPSINISLPTRTNVVGRDSSSRGRSNTRELLERSYHMEPESERHRPYAHQPDLSLRNEDDGNKNLHAQFEPGLQRAAMVKGDSSLPPDAVVDAKDQNIRRFPTRISDSRSEMVQQSVMEQRVEEQVSREPPMAEQRHCYDEARLGGAGREERRSYDGEVRGRKQHRASGRDVLLQESRRSEEPPRQPERAIDAVYPKPPNSSTFDQDHFVEVGDKQARSWFESIMEKKSSLREIAMSRTVKVKDFGKMFADGLVLCHIAEVVCGEEVRGVAQSPKQKAQRLNNIRIALQKFRGHREVLWRNLSRSDCLWDENSLVEESSFVAWRLLNVLARCFSTKRKSLEARNHQQLGRKHDKWRNDNDPTVGESSDLCNATSSKMPEDAPCDILDHHHYLGIKTIRREVLKWLQQLNLHQYLSRTFEFADLSRLHLSLIEDPFRNGVLLARLAQILEKSSMSGVVWQPRNVVEAENNVEIALRIFSKLQRNLDVSKLVQGDENAIWSLLYSLKKEYSNVHRSLLSPEDCGDGMLSSSKSLKDGKEAADAILLYSKDQKALLEIALVRWLKELPIDFSKYGVEMTPYRHHQHPQTSMTAAFTINSLFAALLDGVALAEIASFATGKKIAVNHSVKSRMLAARNMMNVCEQLAKVQTVGHRFLKFIDKVVEGNKEALLALLEDLMRCYHGLAPGLRILRRGVEVPFLGRQGELLRCSCPQEVNVAERGSHFHRISDMMGPRSASSSSSSSSLLVADRYSQGGRSQHKWRGWEDKKDEESKEAEENKSRPRSSSQDRWRVLSSLDKMRGVQRWISKLPISWPRIVLDGTSTISNFCREWVSH
mmetsp:Transcript_23466/g.76303  ORF Transcript_23466/g.76303 Transcript_23466/m.76303 type:complete len:964 (-) Transcript_23466:1331-4222(-)